MSVISKTASWSFFGGGSSIFKPQFRDASALSWILITQNEPSRETQHTNCNIASLLKKMVSFPFNKKTCLYHLFFTWQSDPPMTWHWAHPDHHIMPPRRNHLLQVRIWRGRNWNMTHMVTKFDQICRNSKIWCYFESEILLLNYVFWIVFRWGCLRLLQFSQNRMENMHFLRKKRCCSKLLLVKVARIFK